VGSTPVNDLISGFGAYMRRTGRSRSSVEQYMQFLPLFAEWVGDRDLGDITAAMIENDYLAGWWTRFEDRRGHEPKPNTVRAHLQALRSLYKYADRFDFIVDETGRPLRNPALKLELPKIRRQIKPWVTAGELDKMLEACLTEDERFLVAWLWMTAMRQGEASKVPWANVDLSTQPGSILITDSKTDGRRITLLPELRVFVQQHLARQRERGLADPSTPVWCSRHGKGITEQQANRTLKRIAARAGLTKKVSCHSLRRGWAMTALERGMSTEAIADHLGNEPQTTATYYARVQRSQVEAEVVQAFG